MKITEITIIGMHKVDKKTYKFNPGVTYFVGENGAGKSTILEAVQLALLGYIPGYSKTNESIMKHASGPVMSIEAKIDDSITIIRSWSRSGSSVTSHVDVIGYDGELKDLIGEVELPVFDFNEFRSMTANKLKDWFMTFLPSSDDDLDMKAELENAASARAIPADELVNETLAWIEASKLTGLELVRALNAKFKEDQSYTKGQIANLEGTVKSLIRYDISEELDEEEINNEIKKLEQLKSIAIRHQAHVELQQRTQSSLDALKAKLPAERFDEDERVSALKAEIEQATKKLEIMRADYSDIQSQINDIKQEQLKLPRANATCPYTNEPCDTAAKIVAASAEKLKELNDQLAFKQQELADCDATLQNKIQQEIFMKETQLNGIHSDYDQLIAIQLQLDNLTEEDESVGMTPAEIDAQLADLRNKQVQVQANKRYDELSDKVTADKFKLQNDLEIYKLWAKLTDANNLQTQLMNKPFEGLAAEMSAYLSKMFNTKIAAKFNLSTKANSFSFGLERDGQYLEFDYLSSGERCLFTLALIMCILDKSNSSIRTILVDDILDHLDADNASHLFESLKNVTDIQFILAGVKECSDKAICSEV